MEAQQLIHKWEAQGLGQAPFTCVGLYSLPARSLAEHNPQAYQAELAQMPKGFDIGTCAVCGMALTNNFLIRTGCGRQFSVGCDCVKKAGDAGLVDAVIRQLLRFCLVGGAATGLMFGLLWLLVELAGLPPTPASALGYCVSAAFNYLANRRFTFQSDAAHQQAAPRFAAVMLAGLGLNSAIMALGTIWQDFHYLLVQIVATGVVLLWNFLANRYWTFRAR